MSSTIISNVVDLPRELSASGVERYLVQPLEKQGSLTLRVSRESSLAPLAGARLLGLLAEARSRGWPLKVRLASDLDVARFGESSLGSLLCLCADSIRDDEGLSDMSALVLGALRNKLSRDNGIAGADGAYLLPVVDFDLPQGQYPSFPALTDLDGTSFPHSVQDVFGRLIPGQRGLVVEQVTRFIYEMWHNTHLHALDELGGTRIRGIRAVLINRRPSSQVLRAGAIESHYSAMIAADFPNSDLLEVTVVDSGIGIGTRFSGDPNFKEWPGSQQLEVLREAVRRGASSRHRPGSGLGYTKVFRVLNSLRGLLLVTTGPLAAAKSFVEGWPSFPSEDIQSTVNQGGWFRGTAASLILPLSR